MERWKGKVAVMTGANGGIGASTVKRLVDDGLIVVGIDREISYLEALKVGSNEKRIYAIKADIKVEDEVVNAFEWIENNLGLVHVLINCAGVVHSTSLISGEVESWKDTFEINVVGLSITTREAVQNMKANNTEGHIINISSYLGHITNVDTHYCIYSASKHAVRALTESLRKEVHEVGCRIKVTSISPGITATNLLTQLLRNFPEKRVPAHLEPEDVANCIMFALSTPAHVDVTELTVRPLGVYSNC